MQQVRDNFKQNRKLEEAAKKKAHEVVAKKKEEEEAARKKAEEEEKTDGKLIEALSEKVGISAKNLCSYSQLEMQCKQLNDDDSYGIAALLRVNGALNKLYLQENNLTDKGKQAIRAAWGDREGTLNF